MFYNTLSNIKLLFRKDKELFYLYSKLLGYIPNNIDIYREAFLHRSSSMRISSGRKLNNERLEFLGDAILDAIVADVVYKRFPGKREGFLTNTRSKIVQRDTLNKIASNLHLEKYIKYSTHTASHNNYMGGNALEALIGAIYLDRGYRECRRFVLEHIINPYIDVSQIAKKEVNFKSRLIEWTQKNHIDFCFTVTESKVGNKKDPYFSSSLYLSDILVSTGEGYSKKESQQYASEMALQKIKEDKDLFNQILEASNFTDAADNIECDELDLDIIPSANDKCSSTI